MGIRLTPAELKAMGEDVIAKAEQLEELMGLVRTKVTEVQDSWEGAAQSAFVASYEEMSEALSQFPQIVDGIGQQVVGAAEAFDSVDTELGSAFSGG